MVPSSRYTIMAIYVSAPLTNTLIERERERERERETEFNHTVFHIRFYCAHRCMIMTEHTCIWGGVGGIAGAALPVPAVSTAEEEAAKNLQLAALIVGGPIAAFAAWHGLQVCTATHVHAIYTYCTKAAHV